jgi:hypothetical protein
VTELEVAAEASLSALQQATVRVADLVVDAAELDERTRALVRRERELAAGERELNRGRERQAEIAEDLARREHERALAVRELELERESLQRARALLEQAQRDVEARERALEEKAARLRWRWLLRAWRWRPPVLGHAFRVCEFLLVSTPAGYVLLEQGGVAVRRGSILTGLLGRDTSFVVTNIAPWQFDGRWCAYLQQINQPTEE